MNGGVWARTTKGPVQAISVNGPVHAAMAAFGDTGQVKVVTVNGSATVELPERLDAEFDVTTVNGNISSDYPVTIEGKFVGKEAYAAALAQQDLTIPEFEKYMSEQILLNRLRSVALESTVVSQADIAADFRLKNEKAAIEYVKVDPSLAGLRKDPRFIQLLEQRQPR